MDAADLVFLGPARQAELVAAGEVAPSELVEASLQRIAALDPQLNAFRVVFAERARAEARQADGRRGAGDHRPLLGVPVAIKDDQHVAGEVTAFGSNAAGAPETADSEVVRRLREAGAIVVGKTNVSELTIWPWTETATWGATRNPWDPQRTPGGSSGGSASAVAAGLVPFATGSDGLGSIRIPAACCGLYGLKPQRGRVSVAPKVDPWLGLAHYGTLARSVRDTAVFLDATADEAPAEPFAAAAAREPGQLRIALSTKIPPGLISKLDPEMLRVFNETAQRLRSLGHDVSERDPDYGQQAGPNSIVRYLRGIHEDARAMEHPERLERRTRSMARMGGALPAALVDRSRRDEAPIARRLNALFDDFDVLLTPALAQLPTAVGRWQGYGAAVSLNRAAAFVPYFGPWNVTGQPACTIPSGWSAAGLPISVHLVARPDDEATLLSLSAQLEAASPWADRRPQIS